MRAGDKIRFSEVRGLADLCDRKKAGNRLPLPPHNLKAFADASPDKAGRAAVNDAT
jgi:hypothetical protein